MKFLNFIKKTILFIVKQIFKLAIDIAVIGVVIVVLFNYFSKKSKPTAIKPNSFVEIDLSSKYGESGVTSPLSFRKTEMGFYNLLKSIDEVNKDESISGILLKIDGNTLGRAKVEELGKKFIEFKKSGKKIYAYGTTIDNTNYSIATYADKIIMPPTSSASVNINGYFKEMPYFKKLSDLVGIKFNVIHVGDYKSYGENYIREDMSAEYRENTTRILNILYENFISKVSINRKIDSNMLNDRVLNGDLMVSEPYNMLKYNMIDETMYYDDLKKELAVGDIIDIYDYSLDHTSIKGSTKDRVAIIYADGEINYGSDPTGLRNKLTPESFGDDLDVALEDDKIKGIVIRVNSPGGSALASDIIYSKIKNANKPIYISIGEVAASGGYYISAAGKKIYADRESLTGSIGVVSLIPNAEELVKKLDVNMETLEKGKYSSIYSLVNNFTPDDKDKIYAANYKVYSEFLDRVREGRKMNREDVHKIAQGKVWLGQEAVNIGLVDKIGGLEETISALAKDINLSTYDVVEIKKSESLDSIVGSYVYPMTLLKNSKNILNGKTILNDLTKNELLFRPVTYFPYDL